MNHIQTENADGTVTTFAKVARGGFSVIVR